MQPSSPAHRSPAPQERALIMEGVMLEVRQRWFGARLRPAGCATAVVEPGGELFMCVDGDAAAASELIDQAEERKAYVVSTTLSRPTDLASRLRRAGFRTVSSQQTYVLDEAQYARARWSRPQPARRNGLLALFRREPLSDVTVHPIDMGELYPWNAVCWRAFGERGNELHHLEEKRQAFDAMGAKARWYLASSGGRAVGTAILYQGEQAAQVLAVGTLPALRGRGVARGIMHRLVADWQESGHGFLFLDTTPGSTAERLYQQMGFAPVYLRETYAPPR